MRAETDCLWELRVVAGPDAGRSIPLPSGRTVIGGPACRGGVAISDHRLAPFHAVLTVTADGVTVEPLADALVRPGRLSAGEPLRLGASVAWLDRVPHVPVPPDVPSRVTALDPRHLSASGPRMHHRPPRRRPPSPPAPPRDVGPVPAEPLPASASPVPALLGAAVTVVIAVVIGQPMLALLGLSGSAVAVVTWGHGRVVRRRRRRAQMRNDEARAHRRSAEIEEHRRSIAVHRRLGTSDLCDAVSRALTHDPRVWERRPTHDDVWVVVVGVGESFVDVAMSADGDIQGAGDRRGCDVLLHDVPVTVALGPGAVVGLSGSRDGVIALVRSMVVQLVASVGPADLVIEVLVDSGRRAAAWEWIRPLPHETHLVLVDPAADGAGRGDVVPTDRADGDRDPIGRHCVRIIDTARPVRLTSGCDGVVVIASEAAHLPAATSSAGVVGERGTLRWFGDASGDLPTPALAACCPAHRADEVVASLAMLRDPDDVAGSALAPVALADLVPSTPTAIVEKWSVSGVDPVPFTVLGRDVGGRAVGLDLARDGPHAVIGGTTGSGKSEMLRSLVVGLAAHSPPSALSFVLVDFKGGAAFDACVGLPHVVGVLTDLDARTTRRAVTGLDAELHRRERLLRAVGAVDLSSYRAVRADGDPEIARLVIVIDEFASLATEMPDVLQALVGVAQRGRSLGLHLVLATQRPAGAVTDEIRANTSIRIALRVATPADALDVVGDASPAGFPRGRPGRAMLRLAGDPPTSLQVAVGDLGPGAGGPSLVDLVTAVGQAAHLRPESPPHRPWAAPLPDALEPSDLLHPHDQGVVDDVGAQCRRPLRWHPEDGHLVVVGAASSGCTSTLRTVVRQLAASRPDVEVHVVDGVGDRSWDATDDLAVVGSVIRLDETERLVRVLAHLDGVISDRRRGAVSRHPVVLVVDGLAVVRRAVEDEGAEALDLWDAVVTGGPAAGVVMSVANDQASGVPLALLARAGRRWIHALADPLDASLLGAPARAVPERTAPSGRVLCLPEQLEAQVLAPGGHAPQHRDARPAPTMGVLPRSLSAEDFEDPVVSCDTVTFTVGVGARDLRQVRAHVDRGDHLMVIGPARSGRTTMLRTVARAWLRAGCGRVVVVPGRDAHVWHDIEGIALHSAVDAAVADLTADLTADLVAGASDTPGIGSGGGRTPQHLLIVDDADRVDDASGDLERLATGGQVNLVAAVRAERVRGVFGHWTAALRRSRSGLVLGGSAHIDGCDLLGASVPRRAPAPASVGRGWWIEDGVSRDLVQTPGR